MSFDATASIIVGVPVKDGVDISSIPEDSSESIQVFDPPKKDPLITGKLEVFYMEEPFAVGVRLFDTVWTLGCEDDLALDNLHETAEECKRVLPEILARYGITGTPAVMVWADYC
jgi:hypothetical protein